MQLEVYNGKRVELFLTSNCNINCSHCYISFKGSRKFDEAKKIVKTLISKGYKVKLNGAENLTHLEFLPLYKMCGQQMIMTNGLIIYKEPMVLDLLKESGITKVYMSYHFDLHSIVSPIPQNVILENIKKCNEKGMIPRLLTTISSTNYDKVFEMCYDAYNIGAKGIGFTNYIYLGNAQKNDLDFTLTQSMIDIALEQIDKARKLFAKEDFLIERCGSFGSFKTSINFDCHAGIDNISITPDNKVYMCNFLMIPNMEIGYLKNETIFINKNIQNNRKDCLIKSINNLER